MFYGAGVWDPLLIVGQIVCLQCLYYLTLGLLLAIFVATRVSKLSLFYFFDFAALTPFTLTGFSLIASFLLSSLAGGKNKQGNTFNLKNECRNGCFTIRRAVYLFYLVERAKKCLDFAATLYIIHLFICIVYGGWPSSFTWWIVNITGLAVMALLGEYLCIKRELRDIPINRYRPNV